MFQTCLQLDTLGLLQEQAELKLTLTNPGGGERFLGVVMRTDRRDVEETDELKQ